MRMLGFIIVLIVFYLMGGCVYKGYDNIDWLKERAESTWEKQGFEVVTYSGYQMGYGFMGTDYGSAKVWHRLKKVPDNGITYHGYIIRWGDEVHVYGPTAIDAIRPR